MYTLGFIGVGHLGSALLDGFLSTGVLSPASVCAYDPDEMVRASLTVSGVTSLSDECEVVSSSKIVIVAVRPGDVRSVMEKIKDTVTFNNVLVSVAAGVPVSAIKRYLGKECKLVRAIPNVACRYGQGVTAMAYAMPITYGELQSVKDLFEAVGLLRVVEERRLNDYIAAASSSAAYFYAMVKAVADGAVAQGLDAETASAVAIRSIVGAAKNLETSRKSVDEMIASVATPRGTTEAALDVMEKNSFAQLIADAMLACTKRANELDVINDN